MLYRCPGCGLVYFFQGIGPFLCASGFSREVGSGQSCFGKELFEISITARANEFSEGGGEMTGINVEIDIDSE